MKSKPSYLYQFGQTSDRNMLDWSAQAGGSPRMTRCHCQKHHIYDLSSTAHPVCSPFVQRTSSRLSVSGYHLKSSLFCPCHSWGRSQGHGKAGRCIPVLFLEIHVTTIQEIQCRLILRARYFSNMPCVAVVKPVMTCFRGLIINGSHFCALDHT